MKNIFEEGELDLDSVVAEIATTAADGKKYRVMYENDFEKAIKKLKG